MMVENNDLPLDVATDDFAEKNESDLRKQG